MPAPYSGNPAGITDAQAVTITDPQDLDALVAASGTIAWNKLADILKWAMDNKATRGLSLPNPSVIKSLLSGLTAGRIVEFSDLGAGGANLNRAALDSFLDATGATAITTYINASLEFEVAVNCVWDPGFGWQRTADAVPASVTRFKPGGVRVYQKGFGPAGDIWTDTLGGGGFDAELDTNILSKVAGDVLYLQSSGLASFGRAQGVVQNMVWAAGWTATAAWGGVPTCLLDGAGNVQVRGQANWVPAAANGIVAFTLPAGFRPSKKFSRSVPVYTDPMDTGLGLGFSTCSDIVNVSTSGVVSFLNANFGNFTGGPANVDVDFSLSFPL